MMASSCQKPIRYSVRGLYCHFIKRQQSYLQSCSFRAIGKTNSIIISYQFPIRFVSKGSFDKSRQAKTILSGRIFTTGSLNSISLS